MKQVKIEVKSCKSCPFAKIMHGIYNGFYANCLAPYPLIGAGAIDSYYKYYKTSPNCPLKKQSLKIEFKK